MAAGRRPGVCELWLAAELLGRIEWVVSKKVLSPQAMPLSGWPKVAPERIHEGREYWPRRHTFGFFWQERCTPMRWT